VVITVGVLFTAGLVVICIVWNVQASNDFALVSESELIDRASSSVALGCYYLGSNQKYHYFTTVYRRLVNSRTYEKVRRDEMTIYNETGYGIDEPRLWIPGIHSGENAKDAD
jgi:hypothetical protein